MTTTAWWDPLKTGVQEPEKAAGDEWWKSLAENKAAPATPYRSPEGGLSVTKFLAETEFAFLDSTTKALSFLSDFVARNPDIIMKFTNPSSLLLDAAKDKTTQLLGGSTSPSAFEKTLDDSWEKAIDATSGRLTDVARAEVDKLRSAPILRPTEEYAASDLEGKLTKHLPETLFHLGANVAGSWLPYLAGAGTGAGVMALSTANDVKGYARESGMPEDQSDALALGTGVLIGLLDKIVPDEIFSSSAVKTTFVKGLFGRLAGVGETALKEAGTEVAQENIQLAAEAVVREDLSLSEAIERNILSALGGFMGGAGAKTIADAFNGVRSSLSNIADRPAPPKTAPDGTVISEPVISKPATADSATTQPQASLPSRIFATDPSKASGSLMDQMRGIAPGATPDAVSTPKYQLGIDTATAKQLNIGNPADPKIGSAFDLDGRLFIVRDIDTDGKLVGYVVPLDGTPTVSLEVVSPNKVQPIQVDIATIKSAIHSSKVPTGIRRSEQFVTNEEAKITLQKYFTAEELTVEFVEKINTPDGAAAFGRYTPAMIELVNNPHQTTADHEAVHAYLDLFYKEGEKAAVYEAARTQMGDSGKSDLETEEWVADRFARFVKSRSGVSGKLLDFFERVVSFLRRSFKRTNPDKVTELFQNIRSGVRPSTPRLLRNIRTEFYQEPEKLTAKIFTFPELSDRVTVGRTYLSDFMKSGKANLKQAERLLLEDVLNTQFKDGDKIDVQAFKKAVEVELLPLDRVSTNRMGGTNPDIDYDNPFQVHNLPKYEGIALPDQLRGIVEDYSENIYNSPIKTSAGATHFSNSEADLGGYFAHTRTEDMSDGTTRRVIEVQSDLFQKGRLEGEARQAREILDNPTYKPENQPNFKNPEARQAIVDQAQERLAEVTKLESYSQAWWQRIIREEIRDAAMAGKKRILFPVGETAMKIEGLGDRHNWFSRPHNNTQQQIDERKLRPDNLFVGQDVYQNGNESEVWIITDVLEDGKFAAMPKEHFDSFVESKGLTISGQDLVSYAEQHATKNFWSSKETFDISGKVDKDNPIYRYYERDVVPYILKSRRGNARLMTDGYGVTWVETALTQEDRGPVIAYQRAEEEPNADYQARVDAGLEPSPDAKLAAAQSLAAFEIEKELGGIAEPGQMPAGLAADLDYRRNLALEKTQELEANEQIEKEQAARMLEEDLVFPDPEMEASYGRFKKLSKRHRWLNENHLEPSAVAERLVGRRTLGTTPNWRFESAADVSAALFASETTTEMSGEELLTEFQSRLAIEEELVEKLQKMTAIEKRAEAKRLAEKLVRDVSIRKTNRVKTVIKAINNRPTSTVTVDEMKLLQRRMKDMSTGSRSGYKQGRAFMKGELMTKWRQSETDRMEAANVLTDYLAETLPPQQRGRFTRAIAKVKDLKTAFKIMDQIDRIEEKAKKREAVDEFGDIVTKFRKGYPNIALDYQLRIGEILSSFDAKKPTENTLRRLNATAAWIEQNPGTFVPKDLLTKLKRLGRKPLAEMTTREIEDVNTTVAELARLGRLKQDLKNVYDEREWEKSVNELIAGTVNRDAAEGPGKKPYEALLAAFDQTNSPARVFDAMDGDKSYAGANVALYKRIRSGSQQAEIVSSDIALEFLEGIRAIGIETLSEEQQRMIYLHSALEQGNGPSVEVTLAKHGIELRDLTEQERKVLDLARATLAKQTDDFAATYEEKHNKQFVRVEQNYIPFRYEGANPTSAEDFVLDERMMKRSVEPGSVKERLPDVRRELRTDFINIMLQAIESQSNYIYVEPAMMDVAALVKSKEYKEAAGEHNGYYWSEYMDAVARNGVSANALKVRFIDPAIRGLRFNVTAAILGGRASTVFLQPFTLFHAHSMMSMRYGIKTAGVLMQEIAKTFLPFSSHHQDVTDQSPALTLRKGGDATVRELSDKMGIDARDNKLIQARNAVIKFSLSAMKAMDMRTAAASNQAIYRVLRSRGMSDAEARSESDLVTDLIASSSQVADKPLVFSKGEGVKMWTMFMSFALNEWGFVTHDIMKTGLIKGDYSAKLRATYALSIIFLSKMLEQVVRDALRDLLRKKEDREKLPSVTAMTAVSAVSVIPWFGPLVAGMVKGYDGQLVDSPVIATTEDLFSGIKSGITGKQENTRIRGWLRAGKSVSTVSGVPFVPLLFDWLKNNLVD
mgnify:CR=1 FL=1